MINVIKTVLFEEALQGISIKNRCLDKLNLGWDIRNKTSTEII